MGKIMGRILKPYGREGWQWNLFAVVPRPLRNSRAARKHKRRFARRGSDGSRPLSRDDGLSMLWELLVAPETPSPFPSILLSRWRKTMPPRVAVQLFIFPGHRGLPYPRDRARRNRPRPR